MVLLSWAWLCLVLGELGMFLQLMSFTATCWLFRVALPRGMERVTVNMVPHPPPSGPGVWAKRQGALLLAFLPTWSLWHQTQSSWE